MLHSENMFPFIYLAISLLAFLLQRVAVTQHVRGWEEARSVNELMNEQKPVCRAHVAWSSREAYVHFLAVARIQAAVFRLLFSALPSTHSLPLTLLHFSFRSHRSFRLATVFFLCSIYLGSHSLIHPHLCYWHAIPFFPLLFALKFYFFSPLEFLFPLFRNYLLCNFFPTTCYY